MANIFLGNFMNTSLIKNQVDISNLDQYAAIIGESPSLGARSPKLWNAAFQYERYKCKMVPLDVESDHILDLLDSLSKDADFIGGAVAVPYKQVVAEWLRDNVTPEAKKIGAVNCLYRNQSGMLYGTNTDGEAARASFESKFGSLKTKSVMILGNGGAGKAVSCYFSLASDDLIIVSRNDADINYSNMVGARWAHWDDIGSYIADVDVIVNCTSIGFGEQVNSSPLNEKQINRVKKTAVIFDIVYQPLKTKLLESASKKSIPVLNGLEMNLEQAILAYKYTVRSNISRSVLSRVMMCA